jgi:ATP-binding cassette subfamily C (CFTR/MRP) protein 4
VGVAVILSLVRATYFFYTLLEASRRLHDSMFGAVIRARILFFDMRSSGVILNRFSRDVGFADEMLPWTFFDFVQARRRPGGRAGATLPVGGAAEAKAKRWGV